MRLLITLVTVLASAFSAVYASGAAAVADPPCRPTKNDTAWSWPLGGPWVRAGPTILRPFEPPPHRWDAGHRGVDLAGHVGEPVRAAGPGVVLYAGKLVDRGVVVIGHGVLRTSYEPVEATLPVGATVALGEQVGTLDAGHCPAGPCLHWGLLTGHGHATGYYDPLLLLGCGQVRLEPVMAGPRSR
ncbi:M23 family metallopeptidase [Actinospica sp.]|jgi:murein DD-endopeptidase MepM/ murein hydrolase activator NlpD|uniref:M23 family metallopeptidase n=1 Tax=Actinospica sp. TaxID=1872142 RepID=UPI002B76CE22|nr:peptidoglycan DD-metalloendopeptidase family protein [Actinospica sp.]HWG28003.1 peptidoglycan DD-metalloendopeptidase family protein [Actinospica sp.]